MKADSSDSTSAKGEKKVPDGKFPPSDILFRLGTLAAFALLLYWMPVYYWSTYEAVDPRDGGVLSFALVFCPASWFVAPMFYRQAWSRKLEVRWRSLFLATCTLLFVVAMSTLVLAYRFVAVWFQD